MADSGGVPYHALTHGLPGVTLAFDDFRQLSRPEYAAAHGREGEPHQLSPTQYANFGKTHCGFRDADGARQTIWRISRLYAFPEFAGSAIHGTYQPDWGMIATHLECENVT
jgi:hypothetical protein